MRETFSDNFKKIFLLKFTEELIVHAGKLEFEKLQEIIKAKELKERKKILLKEPAYDLGEIREKKEKAEKSMQLAPAEPVLITIKKAEKKPEPIAKEIIKKQEIASQPVQKSMPGRMQKPIAQQPLQIQKKPQTLVIPEPKLPQHLEYLRPIPKAGIEIDAGKINPLIKDPAVRIIEASTDENVIVTGTMGRKPTGIVLTKEEISEIILKFSELAKIPVEEGIYRVAVGNLSLSAIVSEEVGSRFIIKKITPPSVLQPKPLRQSPVFQRI